MLLIQVNLEEKQLLIYVLQDLVYNINMWRWSPIKEICSDIGLIKLLQL